MTTKLPDAVNAGDEIEVQLAPRGAYPQIVDGKEVVQIVDDAAVKSLIDNFNALGVAARTIPVLNANLYTEVGTVSDDKSGLVIQFRRGGDWKTDKSTLTAEALFGSKLLQPTKRDVRRPACDDGQPPARLFRLPSNTLHVAGCAKSAQSRPASCSRRHGA